MAKETKKVKITKGMSFAEILEKKPDSVGTLLENGMHCMGCPMAQMETLEEGCIAHGLDPDKVVKELNGEEK